MGVLFSAEEIEGAVEKLAAQIDKDYRDKNPVLLGVLTGAYIFMADLSRKVQIECDIDFVRMDSYGAATESSGVVKRSLGSKIDLKGRHVIIVEEIVDSGLTLSVLISDLEKSGVASQTICTLVDKSARREVALTIDYAGFKVEDGFLIGYGLDYGEKRRNLPYIEVLDED